jgi:hypothetical protein
MIDFIDVPQSIRPGEHIILRCKVSNAYFAQNAKFALKYENQTEIVVLNGIWFDYGRNGKLYNRNAQT